MGPKKFLKTLYSVNKFIQQPSLPLNLTINLQNPHKIKKMILSSFQILKTQFMYIF